MATIPDGYRLFEYVDPFEDLVGPLSYEDEGDGKLRFAFVAEQKHANTGGQIHGGMLMTGSALISMPRTNRLQSHWLQV